MNTTCVHLYWFCFGRHWPLASGEDGGAAGCASDSFREQQGSRAEIQQPIGRLLSEKSALLAGSDVALHNVAADVADAICRRSDDQTRDGQVDR